MKLQNFISNNYVVWLKEGGCISYPYSAFPTRFSHLFNQYDGINKIQMYEILFLYRKVQLAASQPEPSVKMTQLQPRYLNVKPFKLGKFKMKDV